jgi:hypothetical protein
MAPLPAVRPLLGDPDAAWLKTPLVIIVAAVVVMVVALILML